MAERYQLQIKEQATPAAFGHMPNMSVPQTNAFSMMGEQLGKFAEFQKRRQDEWDAASVMNAQVEFDKQLNDYLSNPETGLLNVRKLNGARGLSDETFNYADTIAERIAEQLGNDNQKIAFKKIAEKAKLPYWKHASEYEARQIEEYKKQSFQSSLESANNLLMLNPNDNFVVETAREQVANAIRAQYYGSPDDYIENMISDAYSQMDAQRIAMIAETDPKKAYELLKSEGVKIKPDVAAKLEGNLKKIVERDAVYSIADNYWNKYGGASEEAYNAIYSDPNLTNEQKDMVYSRLVTRSNMDRRWKHDQEEKWRKDWFAEIDKAKDMEEAERIIGKSGASGPDRIRFLNYASSLFEGPRKEKVEDWNAAMKEVMDGKYKTSEEFIDKYKGVLNPGTIKGIVSTFFFSRNGRNSKDPNFVGYDFAGAVKKAKIVARIDGGTERDAIFSERLGYEISAREKELGRNLSPTERHQVLQDFTRRFILNERDSRIDSKQYNFAIKNGYRFVNNYLVKRLVYPDGKILYEEYNPDKYEKPDSYKPKYISQDELNISDEVSNSLWGVPDKTVGDFVKTDRGYIRKVPKADGSVKYEKYNPDVVNNPKNYKPEYIDPTEYEKEAIERNLEENLDLEERLGRPGVNGDYPDATPEALRELEERNRKRDLGRSKSSKVSSTSADVKPSLPDVSSKSSDVTPVSPDVRPASPDIRFTSPDLASPDVRPTSPDLASPDVRPTSNDVMNNVAQVTSSGFVRTADGSPSSLKDMEPAVYRYTEAERTLLDYVRKNNPELLPKIQEVMTLSKIKPIPAHVPGTERMELLSDNSSNESSKVPEVDERVMPDGTPIYADNPYASNPENVKGPLSWVTSMFSATPAAAEEMPTVQQYVAPDNGAGRQYMPPVGQGRPNRDVDRRVMPDGTPIFHGNPYDGQSNQGGRSQRGPKTSLKSVNSTGNIGLDMVQYKGAKVTSNFHSTRDGGKRQHNAIDVWAPKGTPIIMPNIPVKMKVGRINYDPKEAGGLSVRLEGKLPDGRRLEFNILHIDIDGIKVKVNQTLNPGDVIGLVGNTGNTSEGKRITAWRPDKKTGYHLHLGIKVNGKPVDPEKFNSIFNMLDSPKSKEPMSNKFDMAMGVVFNNEGGYFRDKDTGGVSNLGVKIDTLKAAHKKGLVSHSDPKKLTNSEATKIYYEMFWKPSKADKMPDKLATIYFDAFINHKTGIAAKILQQTLNQVAGANLVVDGKVGPKTLEALNKYLGNSGEMYEKCLSLLCNKYLDIRQEVYNDIAAHNPSKKKFIKGWTNRVNRLRKIV